MTGQGNPQSSHRNQGSGFGSLSVSLMHRDVGKGGLVPGGEGFPVCVLVSAPLCWENCRKESSVSCSQRFVVKQLCYRRRAKFLLQQVENDPLPFCVPGMERSDG